MKKIKKLIYYWLPPITLMGLIFFLSTRQRIGVSDVYLYNFIIFKSLHVMEYAILFFLFFRAIRATVANISLRHAYMLAILLALLYGMSDEIHQTFVPTREGTIRDVFIDSIGILLSFEYTKKYLNRLKLLL